MREDLFTALTFALVACSLHAKDYHISTAGLDGNEGSKSKPFKTISAAAQVAQPGDVITVHEGVYRERVNPPRGGESDKKRIVYQAAPGEKVVIKGSEMIKGWKKLQNGVWKVALPNRFFGDFNPYSDVIGGEWYRQKGFARHSGTVYLNGHWLDEARDLERVLAPLNARPLWKAKVDEEHTTIWAQFRDVDPNAEVVEINVRQCIFYPDQPGRSFITVRGFIMRQAATPWSGAMSEQIGLVGTHWSKGWVIENNVISHSMNTGITLGRYKLKGVAMPRANAPGYVQSIRLALEQGWSKQKIGSHVVRNNHISHCEKNGIHGSLGGVFSTITGNTIHDIAMRGWIGGPDVAGLKLLGSQDSLISHNHIYRCGSFGGVWLDWMAQGTRVTGNLLHDNSQDLFMEVNHGPFLVDHNLFLSPRSLKDWSQGGAYAHNLFTGRMVHRPERRRQTPFHKPHTTEVAGLHNIPGGDDRFFNNIFVGHEGLAPYDRAAQMMLMSGNVYLAGAKPSTHERQALVVPDFEPGTKLEEKPDGWWLHLSLDKKWANRKRKLVTTELLGRARIPDQRFENPDGSPLRIDKDFLGKKRDDMNPFPGPFEMIDGSNGRVRVWQDSPRRQ
ncbi:MAG: right-handed parallel beta-helix repeat-containing protein [Planctomycetota bacterium]|jgi:alpha-N-arabinofuranosidase|nr:right-handed parallel beta-helix repeat-containing protein [Planctomycetota bacterium]MDP7130139.1 right-handed parallel beta-helix repeat-containing protein [Planctomycetota bacterium]MDP7249851.1 right-handed parallel beta-helix repeat-containing protein [Planctomycetota bacterium]